MAKGGGSLVSQRLAEDMLFEATKRSIYWKHLPPKPLTWRQRAGIQWGRVKAYVTHLGLAVLNRCDRESDGYDW